MIICFQPASAHLASRIPIPQADVLIKQFSDGEIYVKIKSSVQDKSVWVITATQPPAVNLVELIFLLDALTRSGAAQINLFFLYFGYARQTNPAPGEAAAAERICTIIKQFPIGCIKIMHVHAAPIMQTFLNFENVIDFDFFCTAAKEYDSIAAPDKGAAPFAREVAQRCNKELLFLHKIRPEHEQVKIESVTGDSVEGKKILLVDDIISTGRTMIEAAQTLTQLGASKISVAATHGIFAHDAYERLARSTIDTIYVTNSLAQKNYSPEKVKIYDIASFVTSIIQNIGC